MGRNGVGKTTLLKSIMGLLRPRSGRILFNGKDLTRTPPDVRACAGIGYVPQGREIFPQLTVLENLQVGLLANPERPRTVPESIFEYFPMLKTMLDRKGGVLSGGQQQQLAIARALVAEPHLLILDEPTEGIQPSIISLIGRVLEDTEARGSRRRAAGRAVFRVRPEAGRPLLCHGEGRDRDERQGVGTGQGSDQAVPGVLSRGPPDEGRKLPLHPDDRRRCRVTPSGRSASANRRRRRRLPIVSWPTFPWCAPPRPKRCGGTVRRCSLTFARFDYEVGHIPGAVNLPDEEFEALFPALQRGWSAPKRWSSTAVRRPVAKACGARFDSARRD